MSRSSAVLLGLLAVLALPVPAPAAGGTDEAERQVGFARTELSQGAYDRALRSAESALRLDPTRYDAILLKARAYEGLGNLELAESLTLAYGEFVGGMDGRPEAQAVLDRIRDARSADEQRPRERSAHLRRAIEPETVEVTAPAPPEVGPYRDRVVSALAEGQCNAARSAATELTMTAPALADGWKLAGDAARCGRDLHRALQAYRRYEREGGDEPSTLALIERLAGKYGTLLVRVEAPAEARPIRARLSVEDRELIAEPTAEGFLRLRDLPVGVPFGLTVSGRGLRPLEVRVEPVAAGEAREIGVAPDWLGLATVRVADFGEGCRVQLLTEDSEVVAGAGTEHEISAASAWALVENEYGVQSVVLPVEPDAAIEFDPAPYLPARLAVVGVPAGSTVAVEVTADDGRVGGWTYVLPSDVGEIDLQTGVRLSPVRNFDSLPGGLGTLRVEHPGLGSDAIEVVLETGALNAVTFDWQALPGVTAVVERFASWRDTRARARRGGDRTAGLGISSGVFAAVGGGLLVGAMIAQGEADRARQQAIDASDPMDTSALVLAVAEHRAARGRSQALGVAGSIGLGVSAVGLTLTIVSGGVTKGRVDSVGPWEPEGDP